VIFKLLPQLFSPEVQAERFRRSRAAHLQ